MRQRRACVLFFLFLLTASGAWGAGLGESPIHHRLKVEIKPGDHWITVEDRVSLPASLAKEKIFFRLAQGLTVTRSSAPLQVEKEGGPNPAPGSGQQTDVPLAVYSVRLPQENPGAYEFTIAYQGLIHHAVEKQGQEYARSFSETPGIISDQGVYLAGSSYWVPAFNDELITFTLDVTLPPGWDSVSQGKRTVHEKTAFFSHSTWDSPQPMDQVYLVTARFHEYGIKVGQIDVLAFLRTADESLAKKYLETTGQYLEMYDKLIGPYPYSMFALVENFWETGYGMPSFTLLGEKVIRFPFILHSSYPHELLHNWWGNSVYVDYTGGNWCEGLTTYLADHLIKEQRGEGVAYRKTTLQGYTDYAAEKEAEFPLSKFKSRSDALSSAIGYGKSLMLFHMLRLEVGDELFKKAIQDFYRDNTFRLASFEDIRTSFERVWKMDLLPFFSQWVGRTGAPELRLAGASVQESAGRYRLQFKLAQVQAQGPYTLKVPVAIYVAGGKEAQRHYVDLDQKNQAFTLTLADRPVRIDIDPQFDLFRRLHRDEIAPALSAVFGAKKVLILLPSAASTPFLDAYRELAETWAKDAGDQVDIQLDRAVSQLPTDRAIWLFGRENLHKAVINRGIENYRVKLDEKTFDPGSGPVSRQDNSLVLVVKNPQDPLQAIALLAGHIPQALPGLGRKLPHYGQYSYLAFEGDEPANILKGEWQTSASPMSALLGDTPVPPSLPRRSPLAMLTPLYSADTMMGHIRYLASDELEGRGPHSKGIAKAAAYIALEFKKYGLAPGGDKGSYFQQWAIDSPKLERRIEFIDVIGFLPGQDPALQDRPVVLCAHYDHLGREPLLAAKGNEGKIHYGADDNASGVAVLLESAKKLAADEKTARPIIFIAFSGEELGLLGSAHYLESMGREKAGKIFAAINIDTVGRLTEEKKLMVLGSSSAREWRYIFMGIALTTGIQTEIITQDMPASDQVSFIERGIPAVQLSSGPHSDYHRPGDTVDKIIPSGLVKVAAAAREALVYLAERKEPLTPTVPATSRPAGEKPPASGERQVRTGIIPDFSFQGEGVRIGALSPASPAQKAGLITGDIIVAVDDKPVTDIKGYAAILKSYKPGNTVTLTFQRDGLQQTAKVTLEEK